MAETDFVPAVLVVAVVDIVVSVIIPCLLPILPVIIKLYNAQLLAHHQIITATPAVLVVVDACSARAVLAAVPAPELDGSIDAPPVRMAGPATHQLMRLP